MWSAFTKPVQPLMTVCRTIKSLLEKKSLEQLQQEAAKQGCCGGKVNPDQEKDALIEELAVLRKAYVKARTMPMARC